MFQSNIIVFKEIEVNNQTMFQWFKTNDQYELIPDMVWDEVSHWELLEED